MSSRPPVKSASTKVATANSAKQPVGQPKSGPSQGKGSTTKPQEKTGSLLPWFGLAAVLIGLDQLTKIWVTQIIDQGAVIELTGFFNLVHVLNPGAAFSFLASQSGWQKHFLSIVAIVASIVIVFMMRANRQRRFTLLCLSMILSGALGNLIDRTLYGAVIDFLDFYYQHYHWPAFNVADICISCGAVGLIIDELFLRNKSGDKA